MKTESLLLKFGSRTSFMFHVVLIQFSLGFSLCHLGRLAATIEHPDGTGTAEGF